ncbi:MAG: hypothetical protein LBH44_10975 [Treponema sp.]|nr:hypothetical protein [Treponema sp.]
MSIFSLSCAKENPVHFSVMGTDAILFAQSRAAQEGRLNLSKPQKLEYRFDDTFYVPPNSSLEIEYHFSVLPSQQKREKYSLVLNTGAVSWELPMDIHGILYSIPVDDDFEGHFSIALNSAGKSKKIDDEPVIFQIHSIGFYEQCFGFSSDSDTYPRYTPFVYRNDNGSYVIDVPASFMPEKPLAEIEAVFSSGRNLLEFAGRRFETLPGTERIYIPPVYPAEPAILSGDKIHSFWLNVHQIPAPFPEPISADPALVIEWPKENWRNSAYEIFRWETFPSVLIFDYADYAVQDRMLKRLAFFVEKAGFRGRLARDAEIAALHGWNAHDYRAEDLARFFDAARKTVFPLSDEELELEMILLNEGIIRESSGGITAGAGAIISITRESPDYLRYRFMVHEGFHGLFFIDEDFRDFSRRRWEQLSAPAKRFIVSFFDFQQYDTKDEYLLVNEFMAHVLQQTVSQAGDYFGRNLPSRLDSTWRQAHLPPKNASGTWPSLASAFTAEAEAFSVYVNQRWGLSAGRVWSLNIR